MHKGVHAKIRVQLVGESYLLPLCGPRNPTSVVRFESKCLYQLSHLATGLDLHGVKLLNLQSVCCSQCSIVVKRHHDATAWQHTSRHGAGEVAESSISRSTGSRRIGTSGLAWAQCP